MSRKCVKCSIFAGLLLEKRSSVELQENETAAVRAEMWFYLHKEFRGAGIWFDLHKEVPRGRDGILSTQRISARPGADFIYPKNFLRRIKQKLWCFKNFPRCARQVVEECVKKTQERSMMYVTKFSALRARIFQRIYLEIWKIYLKNFAPFSQEFICKN